MPSFNDICSGKTPWRGPYNGAPPPWPRTRVFVGPYNCPPGTVCKQPEYPCAFNGTDGKTVQELRKIDVLRRNYLQIFVNDIKDILSYDKNSNYITRSLAQTQVTDLTI